MTEFELNDIRICDNGDDTGVFIGTETGEDAHELEANIKPQLILVKALKEYITGWYEQSLGTDPEVALTDLMDLIKNSEVVLE